MGEAKRKVMTSRELADLIDKLVCLRIKSVLEGSESTYQGFSTSELAETTVRMIADGLKRLDHNPGVYVEGKEILVKPPVQA